ncbi:MAG: hypothetical protein CL569_17610 [Alphaproteobacteria bacterium]|nr:hypothetical protein [Alphaproteobacteria bacterium]|tara:strand:- start:141 stop:887 length:747 start_codon:yes stop_codon:yes gene_type:complete
MSFPLDDLLTVESVVALIVAVIAGISRGFTGFGSSLIMTPILSVMYGPAVSVVTALALEVMVSVDSVTRVAKIIPWRTMIPIWIAAWIAVPFGTWILLIADADVMRRVISLIVAFMAILLMVGWRYHGPHRLMPNLGVGVLSGTLNSSTSLGGPPLIFYMLMGPSTTAAARAGLIANVFVVSIPTVAILILNGTLDNVGLWRIVAIFPFFLVATQIGNRIFHATGEKTYRRASAWLLLIVAVGTLIVE